MEIFEELPKPEQDLIRSVLNAVNRNRPDLALNHPIDDARSKRPAFRLKDLNPEEIEQFTLAGVEETVASWAQYDQEQMLGLRNSLLALANGKRLADDQLHDLAGTFEGGVTTDWQVRLSRSGAVSLVNRTRYKDPFAAIAYVVLRLAQLSDRKKALLCCDECKTLALVTKTRGNKSSRFCSHSCRWDFHNARKTSRKQPRKTAAHAK